MIPRAVPRRHPRESAPLAENRQSEQASPGTEPHQGRGESNRCFAATPTMGGEAPNEPPPETSDGDGLDDRGAAQRHDPREAQPGAGEQRLELRARALAPGGDGEHLEVE